MTYHRIFQHFNKILSYRKYDIYCMLNMKYQSYYRLFSLNPIYWSNKNLHDFCQMKEKRIIYLIQENVHRFVPAVHNYGMINKKFFAFSNISSSLLDYIGVKYREFRSNIGLKYIKK
jgi:hypothetical protein